MDKRSQSFSSSMNLPCNNPGMSLEKPQRKSKAKNSVIHNYMMRNQSCFNDKYNNTPSLGKIKNSFWGLARSNSDVIMSYDANKSFNKKYENGYQGDNKYLNAGGNKFKAPVNLPMKLKHKNIIAQSQSGTGKTISFLSIVFSQIAKYNCSPEDDQSNGVMSSPQAMLVTPTRELANQIFEISNKLNKHLPAKQQLTIALFIGGMPIEMDMTNFKKRPDIVIGTTGRLYLHLKDKNFDLQRLRLFIADEADVLLKGKDFRRLFGAVRHEREKRPIQLCCFSATFSKNNLLKYCRFLYPCVKVQNQCYIDNLERNNGNLQSKSNKKTLQSLNLDNLRQFLVVVQKTEMKSESFVKLDWIVKLLQTVDFHQAIIFYNDKGRGDQIVEELM